MVRVAASVSPAFSYIELCVPHTVILMQSQSYRLFQR